MNATIETMEARRMMSVSPLQVSHAATAPSAPQANQILPYMEQDNLYKQTAVSSGTVPQGIIAILIGLRTAPTSQGSNVAVSATTPPANTTRSVAVGDVNGDGRPDVVTAPQASPKALTMTEVLIATVARNNTYAGVFAGATGARPSMISNVTDGTSNTIMWA